MKPMPIFAEAVFDVKLPYKIIGAIGKFISGELTDADTMWRSSPLKIVVIVFILERSFYHVSGSCPSGWSSYSRFCYYLSGRHATFSSAQTACESMRAKLTSIHNAAENNFHSGRMSASGISYMWIGLHDKTREGHFKWVDGTRYYYNNWLHGEPNNSGNEDCGEMRTGGGWNDLPCEVTRSYMCKKEKDLTPPVISRCPSDIETTTELGTSGTTVSWNEPTATDNDGTPQRMRSAAPGAIFPIGATLVEYRFTDVSGNAATCTFMVNVEIVDTIPPEISQCPTDITVRIELGTTEANVNWNEPTATDLSGTPKRTRSHRPRTRFPIGITLVSYTFVDTSGNSADCTFSITVEKEKDVTPPVISRCPVDIETTTELGTTGTTVSWNEPTATDNDGTPQRERSTAPGTIFPIGATLVEYRFTDVSGNAATCTFIVDVEIVDTIPPEISQCPTDITVTIELGTTEVNVNWNEPTATDRSGTPERKQSHTPGTSFPVGKTLVSYTFVDTSGNAANCNFSITVETVDTTPPSISQCPESFDDISGRHVTWKEPVAFDISEEITQSQSHSPGMFLISTTNVVYIFEDSSNNVAYCRFTVNVVYDTTPPSIEECPSDIHTFLELGESLKSISWSKPSASDQYGRVMIVDSTHAPGEHFPVGSTLVVYTFADDSYNQVHCNFSVVVEEVDTTPPTIHSCPSDIKKDIELGTPSIPIYWHTPSAVDMSGNVSLVSESHLPGHRFTAGRWNISYQFVDGSGNKATCNFFVTLTQVDTTQPTIDYCPDDITETIDIGVSTATVSWTEPRASDLSGNVTLTSNSHIPTRFTPFGETPVTYIFTDDSGNIAICKFWVSFDIVDTTSPNILSCPSNVYRTVENGTDGITVSWNEPSASDQSGQVALLHSTHTTGQVFPVGLTLVSYIFADDSQNSASCNFSVSVEQVDTIPPEIIRCPEDLETTIEIGTSKVSVTWKEPLATDQSGHALLLESTHTPGQLFSIGSTAVSYKFVDASNNIATCKFWVTVKQTDTTAPTVFSCPEDIKTNIEMGTFGSIVEWNEPDAYDVSGKVTLLFRTHAPGASFQIGSTDVLYVFRDNSSNIATCTFTVSGIAVDTTPPTIQSCPLDIVKDIDLGIPSTPVYWSTPSATDMSGNVSLVSQTHFPGDRFAAGRNTITYTFVDGSENEALCVFSVTLQKVDRNPPIIHSCPSDIVADIELGTSSTPVYWSKPTATDDSEKVSLISQSHVPGDDFEVGRKKVLYSFADHNENEATCVFFITVQEVDTRSPVINNCPVGLSSTVAKGFEKTSLTWIEPTAIDASGNVTLLARTHSPGDVFYVGSTTVLYLFIDSSRNMAVCTFTVSVDSAPGLYDSILSSNTGMEDGNEGRIPAISGVGLALSLLIIVVLVVVGVCVLLIYKRKKPSGANMEMESLTTAVPNEDTGLYQL